MDPLAQAAEVLRDAKVVIAVTGAGISVESGIPDFRSEDGLWTKYPPFEYATLDAFHANPDKVWALFHELASTFAQVQPNPAHTALAELARLGKLDAVITQNIDNLHQAAGSPNVIEFHGNAARLTCIVCARQRAFDETIQPPGAPKCACGAAMKPDVILFGELIPEAALTGSEDWARRADAVIIVGTSATVYPAADLPHLAREHGARIIECNVEPTEFTRTITDHFLQGPAGSTLPELVSWLRALD
jgi:NAD-dependent deacetylase